MIPENMKVQVKDRIKLKVNRYWGKNLKEIIPSAEQRLELYQEAWHLRESQEYFSKIPNRVLLSFLVGKIGHWNRKRRGAQMPSDNQGYHTISARA